MKTGSLSRLINKLLGRRSADEYRAWLLKYGRIVEGRVLDAHSEGLKTTIFYCYHISNVRYESSQQLTPDQDLRRGRYVPGAAISVRFDPRHPGAAIVE